MKLSPLIVGVAKKIFFLIMIAEIIALVFIVCVAVYIFIINPSFLIPSNSSPVSKCQNEDCVKSLAVSNSFNPKDCSGASSLQLQNQCYYTYEMENKTVPKKQTGLYCWQIKDEQLGSDCLYKKLSISVVTSDDLKNRYQALQSLNTDDCSKILNFPSMEQQCIKDIDVIKKAIDEKNLSLCLNQNDIYHDVQRECFRMVQEQLSQKTK